jgi:DNA-binding IclR family transcriptional regulator
MPRNAVETKGPKVNSVVNALATLRIVAASSRPLGVTEIARQLEINLSSCFNILKTLVNEGFLNFDPTTKKYSLGSGALDLAQRTHDASRLFDDLRPKLSAIAQQLRVTVGFWEIRDSRLILTGVVDSDDVLRIQMVPGQRLPIGGGAMGRAIAAAQGLRGEAALAALAGVNWYRSPSPRTYAREVAETAKRGWALDEGQFLAGVATVASVVRRAPREPAYCLVASGFVGRLETTAIEEVGNAITHLAAEVESSWFGLTD